VPQAPAQLDRGRELATLLEHGADRSGIRLGDDEHGGEHEHGAATSRASSVVSDLEPTKLVEIGGTPTWLWPALVNTARESAFKDGVAMRRKGSSHLEPTAMVRV
jgi:hypothetical protein